VGNEKGVCVSQGKRSNSDLADNLVYFLKGKRVGEVHKYRKLSSEVKNRMFRPRKHERLLDIVNIYC
jgi:hypothetical protein